MDFIFDLLTLPFEMVFNSLECAFGCLAFIGITICILSVVFLVVIN